MVEEYFSDKELGKKTLNSEHITLNVYNGIITIFRRYIKYFGKNYPIPCQDNNDLICGTAEGLIESAVFAEIPNMISPFYTLSESEYKRKRLSNYAILDFIQFCYSNINDISKQTLHSFFNHYHYEFSSDGTQKELFRKDINRVFERNGIVFYLDQDGEIKRHLPFQLEYLLGRCIINTKDSKLNELINMAVKNIIKPKKKDRVYALEKLWDAFERLKTHYSSDKKQSANELISNVVDNTENFDKLLNEEFATLTKIGNNYQIRHFETNKIEIKSLRQVDYLFYRMMSLISLCLDAVNEKDKFEF